MPSKYFEHKTFLIIWCLVASFGTYFCMYAFRKPFNTGLYEGLEFKGLGYKSLLIITQVMGYMTSKFIGIKVIAELEKRTRIKLIICLVVIAEFALVLFGLVAYPYNWIFLFLNGLPLGMVWGIVFSFLEGRQITEFITVGLSLNLIIGSGFLKTIYLCLHQLTGFSEFWMPAFIGGIFLPFFLLFVWMLSKIPTPNPSDLRERTIRKSLTRVERSLLINEYKIGLISVVILYVCLTTLRDFRDNYSIEILTELGSLSGTKTFAFNELCIGGLVLIVLISVGFFKNNQNAFLYIQLLIFIGCLGCGLSTRLFQVGIINAKTWFVLLGFMLFMPYLLIQTLFFERLISVFSLNANAGFFVYICDSFGYLGSVLFLFSREIFRLALSFSELLVVLSYVATFTGVIFCIVIVYFFKNKQFHLT